MFPQPTPAATQSVTLHIGETNRPFHFRPGTSDESVMHQIFTQQHHSLDRLHRIHDIRRLLAGMQQQRQTPLVLDLGANIGASSVFFGTAFPGSRVIAVEPEPANYALLCQNTRGLNILNLQAAIGAQPGRTRLVDAGIGPWGYRTAVAGAGPEVPQVTIPQILAQHGAAPCRPFLVKIDIEGGERDLFASNTQWVQQFPVLIIELHDWLLPGGGTALPFLRCIAPLKRDFVYQGENIFSIDHAIGQTGTV